MKTQRKHIGTSNKLRVISTNGTHGAHQGFSVEPGESYTFEIDLHRPAGMNKEINVVIWKNTGPSGALSVHVLNVDGTNTFTYNATSSDIFIQIRQAGTYYLDNIRMYRTYEDTIFVSGYEVDRAYRYGYNTQERVPEIQKDHYTAPYWEYDPRVVHRWNRDPMSFKYPWQSPYVINNNNPLFYTDPFGLEGEDVIITGEDSQKAFDLLKESSSLQLSIDLETGKLTAEGKAENKADKKLLKAINNKKITVELRTTKEQTIDSKDGTKNVPLTPAAFEGSTKNPDKSVTALQIINIANTSIIASILEEETGQTITHEINEAYFGAKQNPGGDYKSAYQKAHKKASKSDNSKVNHTGLDINLDKKRGMIQVRKTGDSKWIDLGPLK